MQSFSKTHIGQRKVNEDSNLIVEELGLYIVADGVGGMDKGEVASKLACQIVHQCIEKGLSLEKSVLHAHHSILSEIKKNQNKHGMATTIVALHFDSNSYELAWVGDSRAYLWNNKDLTLITKDDSYVETLLDHGNISIDELETHPDRNVISQALGVERKQINVNHNSGTLIEGQTLLICSDGLYNVAKEFDIIEQLKKSEDLEEITSLLVDTAVQKDGKDNITLIGIKNLSTKGNDQVKIKPTVYREFDRDTGQIIGSNKSANQINNLAQELELDPELIDQTSIKDLTSEQMGLIDSAIVKKSPIKQKNNVIFPVILVSILILVGLFIFN